MNVSFFETKKLRIKIKDNLQTCKTIFKGYEETYKRVKLKEST